MPDTKRFRNLDAPPVLIGGCARSGTSLLLSVLSAHPSVYAIEQEEWAFLPRATRDEFAADCGNFCRAWADVEVPDAARRWAEKTPKNVVMFGPLLDAFGDHLRLIHIVRDGRDVVTSMHPEDEVRYWVPVEQWIGDASAGLAWFDHPQVLTVRYEDLVANHRPTVARICEFLEEPLTDTVMRWHDRATVRQHSSWGWSDVSPLFTSSVRRWERPEYRDRVDEFMRCDRAAALLGALGYLDDGPMCGAELARLCERDIDHERAYWLGVERPGLG